MEGMNELQQINPVYIQWFFIGLSLFFILLELPLAMNRVGPNPTYGFRVKKTLSDERVWYLVNSYAAKMSIVTGIITIVLAVVLRMTGLSTVAYGLACSFILLGGLALTIIMTMIYMKQIS